MGSTYLEGVALNVMVVTTVSFFCGSALQVVVNIISNFIPANDSITTNMFVSLNFLTLFFIIFVPLYGRTKSFYISYMIAAIMVYVVLNLLFGYLSIKDANPGNLSYTQAVVNTIPYMSVVLFPTILTVLYAAYRVIAGGNNPPVK